MASKSENRLVMVATAIYDNLILEGHSHEVALREVLRGIHRATREECATQVRDELGGVLRGWDRSG